MPSSEDDLEVPDLRRILTRKMVWDIIPCPRQPDVIRAFGLMPGTEEGNQFEHDASHRRLNKLLPIAEAVELLGGVAGEVVGRSILESQGIDPTTGSAQHHTKQHATIGIAVCIAVIANLIDYDLLHIGDVWEEDE